MSTQILQTTTHTGAPQAAQPGAPGEPVTAWDALRLPPQRFLTSSWPWRAFAYLLTGSIGGFALLLTMLVLLGVGILASITVVGAVVLVSIPLFAIVVAAVERRRLGLVDREPAPSPHRYVPTSPFRPWLGARLTEGATWREVAHVLVVVSTLLFVDVLGVAATLLVTGFVVVAAVVPVFTSENVQLFNWTVDSLGESALFVLAAPVAYAFAAYLSCAIVGARAKITRLLLVNSDGRQYVEVVSSRARLVDAFEAERRRLERDLHDGTQAHLVTLAFRLGVAELELAKEGPDRNEVRTQVAAAHGEAKEALQELRDLIRGIFPQVLTDRGLSAAVAEVAGRSPVPVTVKLDLALRQRLPAPVETAAYFVVTEALTNVARHSMATQAFVTGRHDGRHLVVSITDNGSGGADPDRGSGLQGLADRLAVVAGRLVLSSPPGGPTVLTLEIPCPTVPSRS